MKLNFRNCNSTFRKRNPLLGSFNNLMRRYLEAGILERIGADLQYGASLIVGDRES